MSPKRQKVQKKLKNKEGQREVRKQSKVAYTSPAPKNNSTNKNPKPQGKYEIIPEDLDAFI